MPRAEELPKYWEVAKKELSGNDTLLSKIIDEFEGLELISRGDVFYTLIRSIVGQQISVKAASTVWSRFCKKIGEVKPENILLIDIEELRNCGLSRRKAEYVIGISENWPNYEKIDWETKDDEEIIEELIKLRGVGRWTVEMILIFSLLRPDIFPIGDIGIIRGIERTYNSGEKMSKEQLLSISEKWRPWRTVACCYMWRTIDPEPVGY